MIFLDNAGLAIARRRQPRPFQRCAGADQKQTASNTVLRAMLSLYMPIYEFKIARQNYCIIPAASIMITLRDEAISAKI